MRAFAFCCLLLTVSAVGAARGQDTNFAKGPQYLMSKGPAQFARPLSTPSLSLASPVLDIGASNATEELAAGAGNQTPLPPAQAATPPDLFSVYYGEPAASTIAISVPAEASPRTIPPSILDTGVWQMSSFQALRGYGATLAEAAAISKTEVRHAARVYTNADIDRLHGGG